MNGFTSLVVCGNLVRDPDIKYSKNGTPVAEFGIAVNRRGKDQQGNKTEEVAFFDVTCFNKTAEFAAQYLQKGKPVAVIGHLQQNRWETQDGQKRSKIIIVAERINFLPDGKNKENEPSDQY